MASVARRRRERLQAGKEKRKKIFAIVGACVMLVVLGIQVPKLLDLLSSDTPPAAPVAPPPPAAAPEAPPPPPETLRLLSAPAVRSPFTVKAGATDDPAPRQVAWPAGARDPFVPAGAGGVLAPERIVVGEPGSGTPTVGYIVVLASIRTSAGRAVAERIAKTAREDGLSPVGVVDSSTSRALRAGYYVAYVGPFATARAVRNAVNRAQELGYRTAYRRELVRY